MKKLLALAILPIIFFTQSCFAIESIRACFEKVQKREYNKASVKWSKRLSTTLYANAGSIIYDIGYDYTDDIKISIGPSIPVMAFYEGVKASEEAQKWFKDQLKSGRQITPENWMQQAQNEGHAWVQTLQHEPDLRLGILVNLHYYHKLAKMNIRPYISAGIGIGIDPTVPQDNNTITYKYFLPLKMSVGANLPIFSSTNIFAGYGTQRELKGFRHGIEIGISRKL